MKTIYARKTKAMKIADEVATKFTQLNHRDGVPSRITGMQSFALMAADTENIVAVAIMGNPRTRQKEREYSSELVRLTFKKGVRVVGGASKLLKHIMVEGDFYDFFTYQDTSNEATELYAHSGMQFVSQSKRKEYLVKDGYTLASADRNQMFSMAYAVQYGPDRIIGTKLGQDTGKTNRELFLDSGYHIETTTGDRVYEWFNPKYEHYTYRITSIENDGKYYIGASARIKGDQDTYMGSGGKKFTNWKNELKIKHGHSDVFEKEILGFYSTREQAFSAEKSILGNSYKTDPLCKNSTSGGRGAAKRQHNGKGVKIGINDLESQRPDLSKSFDLKRNYPLTPKDLHVGTPQEVFWICEKGHSWKSELRKRVIGFGCPVCAGQSVDTGTNDLKTLFPEIAKQLVPGQGVESHEIMAGSHKRLLWECALGHQWEARVDSRAGSKNRKGRGCPFCSGHKVLKGFNDCATTQPDLIGWYSDKNTIRLDEVTDGSNKVLWWICPEGHEFDMAPAQKKIGSCPICTNKRVQSGVNDLATLRPDLISEYSSKNTLDPTKVSLGNSTVVEWVCPHGHRWNRTIRNRTKYNSPCPTCKKHGNLNL